MKKAGNYIIRVFLATGMLLFILPIRATKPVGQYLFEKIIITGSTNVNKFRIIYSEDDFSYFSTKEISKNSNFRMELPVNNFQASPEAMLKDFLTLINAKKYPKIAITIKDRLSKEFFVSKSHFKPSVEVVLNGVSNVYECDSDLDKVYFNEWYFVGHFVVKLSDFNIEPPVKMLGLVKVKDELQINFNILFVIEESDG